MKKYICKVVFDGLMEDGKMIDGQVIEAEDETGAEKLLQSTFSPMFEGWYMEQEDE